MAGPPAEVVHDRIGTAFLVCGALALLVSGLALQPVIVSETEATEENARVVQDYVEAHATEEVRRNLGTANTIRLGEGFFRTCIALDDRTEAFCLLVDVNEDPASVGRTRIRCRTTSSRPARSSCRRRPVADARSSTPLACGPRARLVSACMNQKISVGRVIEGVFETYRDYAAVLLPVAAVVFLIEAIVSALVVEIGWWLFPVSAAVTVVATALFAGMVVTLVSDIQDGRRDSSVEQLLKSVTHVLLPLIAAGFVAGIAIGFGFILLIVPGLILLTIWAVFAPAIVLERAGVFRSLGRSRELVSGNGWQVFGVIVIICLIAWSGSRLCSRRIGASSRTSWVGSSSTTSGRVLTAPLTGSDRRGPLLQPPGGQGRGTSAGRSPRCHGGRGCRSRGRGEPPPAAPEQPQPAPPGQGAPPPAQGAPPAQGSPPPQGAPPGQGAPPAGGAPPSERPPEPRRDQPPDQSA